MRYNSLGNKKNIFLIIAAVLALVAIFFLWRLKSAGKSAYNADVIITNAKVVTMDSQSHVYSPGYVVIKNTKIIAVGSGQPPAEYSAQKLIDSTGQAVLPGLVNTHSHAAMALLAGLVPNQPLKPWLAAISQYEKGLTSDDVFWGSMLAENKMIKSGITTFNDMYFFPEQTLAAVKNAGMRALIRISTSDNGGQIVFDDQMAKQNQNNPLISFSVSPNPLLNYNLSELRQFSDYALAKNYPVHIHFEEDAQARSNALSKYGLTPLQLITQAGFLRNKVVLAHAGDLAADEINQLGKYANIGVSFNPLSEFNLSTPLTPAPALINQNITVGFGTDGEPGSNLDMFSQVKFAAQGYLNCRAGEKFCQNSSSLNPEKIMRMATIDGAKILGLDKEIGSLEAGKQADIIIVNTNADLGSDIYSALVYNTSGEDVADTIVGGRLLMENRNMLTINESDLLKNTGNIIDKIRNFNNH